jgi:putative membrane protein
MASPPSPRTLRALAVHFSQGLLMGSADIIPGVSGGTMALIVGIYKNLIDAIGDAVTVVLLLVRGRWREAGQAIRALEWTLLLPVVGGILLAIALGSLFIPALLDAYPVECRALFFGLVAGSLVIPWRERRTHRGWHYAVAAAGAAVAFVLVGLPRSADAADPALLRVGLTAAVAINAMILPGVSGAFLLEVFGLYRTTLDALRALDVVYVGTFALGAALGLGAAAKLLSWLLDRHHDLTMAVLVGLLTGSLRALWPWVGTVAHPHSDGSVTYVPDPSALLAPGEGWPLALALGLGGFAFVTALAWFGRRRLDTGEEILAAEHDDVHA